MTNGPAVPDVAALLREAGLFSGLGPGDLQACAARFRPAAFAKGEMIFARGDPGAHIYVVAEGQIRLAISTSEGRELSFEIVGPGAMFGEIAVLDGEPRSADATALAPTRAFLLRAPTFNSCARRDRLFRML